MTVKVSKPAINVREELADLRKPTGLAGEAMLRAETPQEQFNLIGAGRRNLIINGDMRIAQRGTSQTVTTSGQFYVIDRFAGVMGSSYAPNVTVSQESDAPSGFASSLKVRCDAVTTPSSTQNFLMRQSLEGQDLQCLGYGTSEAKYIAISFYVKASQTGTRGLWVMCSPAKREWMATYTINQANTWEYKTILIPPNTLASLANDNATGILFCFPLSTGSSDKLDASTSWENESAYRGLAGEPDFCDAVGNTWQITGFQVELGKVATPFEHRSYGEELALAQRFYQRFNADGNYDKFATGAAGSATNAILTLPHLTSMRDTPTLGYGGNFALWPSGSTVSAMAINYPSKEKSSISVTTTGQTANSSVLLQSANDTSSYLELKAEL
jgi:hypothetical protein